VFVVPGPFQEGIGDATRDGFIGWFAPGEMPVDLTQISRVNLVHYRAWVAKSEEIGGSDV